MLVVSDTSPLINLAIIGNLELLPRLFTKIVIPRTVFAEITIQGADMPGADEIREATWIEVTDGKNKALFTALRKIVDPGEAEAIVVAMETGADLLLIDERLGRQVAKDYDIPVLGLLGILKIAKRKRYINLIKPLLDRLINEAGFRVSENLYREVLTDVGES